MTSSVRTRVARWVALVFAVSLGAATASADETLTYSRDALGRLVKVAHAGTINNGTTACYSYDRADNRSNVTTSTSSDCTSAPGVSFSVNDVSVREGGNLVFTITKTGTAAGTLTVDYGTSDGSATAGSDYTTTLGTLTFLSTDTSKTVTVPTTDDSSVEPDETLLLNLSNASIGSAIGDGQGVGTINDNDSDCAGVSFTITSNGAVVEGGNSVFTITKNGSTGYSCSVSYATGSGSALSGSDFTATSGTLTFTSGQTAQTVSVPTLDDTPQENDEGFAMTLSGPDKSGTLGSPNSATATINDNDQCRGITFTVAGNGAVTEGTNSTFTVTKSGSGQIGSCTVNYVTANGTAVAPGDYTAASGTLSFSLSQTTQTVSVSTIADGVTESAETFSLSLSSPNNNGALGTPSSATATINDTGGVCSGVSFAVSDASTTEGGTLAFVVTKTGTTSNSCSINYATADGTATAPTYYTAKSGTLTFTSTQTSQTVSVNTNDLGRLNAIRTMYLNLSNASGGGGISDSQGIGSIAASGGSGGCTKCM